MKKLTVFCIVFFTVCANAQRKPKIKGNKSVIEVMEDLPAFNTVKLEDDLNVLLEASQIPGYSIVADDNLIDIIRFDVTDSVLVIRSFYKITSKKQLDITIKYKDLKHLLVESGSVISPNYIETEILNVKVSDGAKVELKSKLTQMHLQMEDMGKGDFNVEADSVSINLRDKSSLTFYGQLGGLDVNMYDNSQAVLEGTSDRTEVDMFGSSDLKAEQMESAHISAKLEGSAKAKLNAYKEFSLSASGMSKTYLWGNPTIDIKQFLNSSELYKKEE